LRECVVTLGLSNELARLQQLELIDWPAAARAKILLLRKVWSQLGSRWAQSDHKLALSFRVFRQHGGTALEDHARFEALHTQQFKHDPTLWNWRNWAAPLRDPTSATVADFAQQHADEISFHIFLQWLASRGLDAAQTAARDAGMAIGLIADLAVGTDSGGSHVWSRQREFLVGVAVGAPPDAMNTRGQDWGLTTFSPVALRQHAYAPFLEMLRATLRHAGGLRIDHILGLRRLWVLPSGGKATEGVYLSYPQQDLLNLIALESMRHRAVIVGEDLGTVPPGFSQNLADAGVLGMQVLWFQRDHGFFIEPSRWSGTAMATTTTHDVPPIASWWRGHDIDWLAQLDMLPEGSTKELQLAERNHDRQALWSALNYAGVCSGEMPAEENLQTVVDAVITFVAKTPAPLAIIPLEDLFGIDQQLNIPGTTDEHPNWRRRLSASAETLLEEPAVKNRLQILNRERGG
jgi:4-alpha-glucanotransferase